MTISRWSRHLLGSRHQLTRHFPVDCLAAIKAAIARAEAMHRGEIRFAVEAALQPEQLWRGLSARERALEVFSTLRVWDTEHNNGVLIYVLLADRAVEIVVDRGIHTKSGGSEVWRNIITAMQSAFAEGHFASGSVDGVAAVAAELACHFGATGSDGNELPDDVVLLK